MKKVLCLLFLTGLLFLLCGCNQTQKETVNEYNIVPLPNQMTPKEGRFRLSNKMPVITADCSGEVQTIADSLISRIQNVSGITLQAQYPSACRLAQYPLFNRRRHAPGGV